MQTFFLILMVVGLWFFIAWAVAYVSCDDASLESFLARTQRGCACIGRKIYRRVEKDMKNPAWGFIALTVLIISMNGIWAFLLSSRQFLDFIPLQLLYGIFIYSAFAAIAFKFNEGGFALRAIIIIIYLVLLGLLGFTAFKAVQQMTYFPNSMEDSGEVAKVLQADSSQSAILAVLFLVVGSALEFVASSIVVKSIGINWLLIFPAMPLVLIWVFCHFGGRN